MCVSKITLEMASASPPVSEYVGWIDSTGSRIIVRAETIVCLVRRPDKTFFVNTAGKQASEKAIWLNREIDRSCSGLKVYSAL